jgi:hypothetical protein
LGDVIGRWSGDSCRPATHCYKSRQPELLVRSGLGAESQPIGMARRVLAQKVTIAARSCESARLPSKLSTRGRVGPTLLPAITIAPRRPAT